MKVLKLAALYFAIVFGTGFLLALIRIPLLVPQFGVRTAELMEMPFMLAMILWSSRWLATRDATLDRTARLTAGVVALAMMIVAEATVAYGLGVRSIAGYLATRDPVSGSVYAVSLLMFAAAPAVWRSAPASRRHTERA